MQIYSSEEFDIDRNIMYLYTHGYAKILRAQLGINLEPAWNSLGASLEPVWNRPGTSLEPAWNRPGTGLEPAWNRLFSPGTDVFGYRF